METMPSGSSHCVSECVDKNLDTKSDSKKDESGGKKVERAVSTGWTVDTRLPREVEETEGTVDEEEGVSTKGDF